MLVRASLLSTAFALVFAGSLCLLLAAQESAPPVVPFPQNDPGLAALAARKKAQLDSVNQFKVFYQFHFTDKLKESGITFREHATLYSTSDYMAVHYDHGTGIAVADVDGDGLYDIYFVSQLGGNELWRNLGNGKFENITEKAGVGLKDRVSVTASFGDVDNSFSKGLRGFLRQIVPDAARDSAVRVLAREFRLVSTRVRVGRTVRVTFESDSGHRYDRTLCEPLLELVVFSLAFSQP